MVTLNSAALDLVLHQLSCTFLSPVDWFGQLTVLTSASVTNKSLVSSEKAAAVNPFWGRLF